MQFSIVFVLLASVAAVHSAAVPDGASEIRDLFKRQGRTAAECASIGAAHCSNTGAACPIGCLCSGGNLPNGGCCACT
ncbi:hypothetical protein CCHL11_00332 [Colletotrichum chlorophyti]|uniref:Uncharacterized protein n=1 Tax=Colletotrichum chlorophyti TaxID=708187 RepID=A0A1Q8RU04_9PEZI|nr:hypothetical protein CCHL11_00332 [Colletotrichum chlorophyti]